MRGLIMSIDFIKQEAEFDLMGLGEIMLRLSPPGKEKISQGNVFEKNAGGSELNVISGAAMLGARSAMLTKLPKNEMGRYIRRMINYTGVSDRYVVSDASKGARLGVYYYESGAYPRKSSVLYDRAGSSVCSLSVSEIPEEIYDKTRMFHISSISLALSRELRETSIEIMRRMKEHGVAISFDVNYRAALWSESEAREVIERILPMVDVLFVSEETSRRMFARTGTMKEIQKGYCEKYGCKIVATTKREVVSPTRHNFGSMIYCGGEYYEEKPYMGIEVIDRVGSGDAYVGGVLYGLLYGGDISRALSLGNALSAVKNTIVGDFSASGIDEIESVIASHNASGAQDEMVR